MNWPGYPLQDHEKVALRFPGVSRHSSPVLLSGTPLRSNRAKSFKLVTKRSDVGISLQSDTTDFLTMPKIFRLPVLRSLFHNYAIIRSWRQVGILAVGNEVSTE